MSRALASRIRKIEDRVGWSMTVWRKASGDTLVVKSTAMVDAWLRVALGTGRLDLDPKTALFIATSQPPRQSEGDMVRAVWEECRRAFFPPSIDRPPKRVNPPEQGAQR